MEIVLKARQGRQGLGWAWRHTWGVGAMWSLPTYGHVGSWLWGEACGGMAGCGGGYLGGMMDMTAARQAFT